MANAKNRAAATVAAENALILREGRKIVEALGKMFAPCCEVVLHDLTRPDHAITAIECPISGRKVGDQLTELGLARIADSDFPAVVQNYPNEFPDGHPAKSTAIGLKNGDGVYVAAICLNLDISLLSSIQRLLEQFTATGCPAPVREHFRSRSIDDIHEAVSAYATQRNVSPLNLSTKQRRELLEQLDTANLLQLRNAIPITAKLLGISRSSIYHVLRSRRSDSQ